MLQKLFIRGGFPKVMAVAPLDDAGSQLTISLFGPLEVRLNGLELTVNGFPARAAVGLWKRPGG